MQTQVTQQAPIEAQADGRFLRRVFMGNALFSMTSAIISMVAAKPLAAFLGAAFPAVFVGLGLGLLPFAWFCYDTARQAEIDRHRAVTILVLDIVWVAASAWLLLSGWLPLTVAARWTVGLVAEAVAVFAILEFIGLRRLGSR